MDERQQTQLKLQLEHETELANARTSKAIVSVNRSVARRGLSGSSIHADQIAEVIVSEVVSFARLCFEHAHSIAPEIDAHTLAKDHASAFFSRWTPKGEDSSWPSVPALKRQGHMGEEITRAKTKSLLSELSRIYELEAFRFSESQTKPEKDVATVKIEKGGRPPAKYWDDMWSRIAAALYNGDLVPKSQADVATAMMETIEALGHSAADSTVKLRARRLWDQISKGDI